MTWAITQKGYSQRRACGLVGLEPKTYRYASKRPADGAIRAKLRLLAGERRRFGYRRLHILLAREGVVLNHKKLFRLYRGDGDGVLSVTEQQSCAERVRQDLSLALDGHPEPLRLVSASFPWIDQLTVGTGDIDLRFEAGVPDDRADHTLEFKNHHRRDIAVYLVNTFLPRDPGIRIVSQDRSYDQSSYRLGVASGAAPGGGDTVLQQRLDRADRLAVVGSYFWHGVHHVLTGYDHPITCSSSVPWCWARRRSGTWSRSSPPSPWRTPSP